ncbi:MAG: glycosyltransferase [Planctomycetota bacterium]
MTVLHVCHCWVPIDRESGGVANVVRQLCLASVAEGREVVLICGDRELGRVVGDGAGSSHGGLTVHVLRQRANPLRGPVGELKRLLRTIRMPAVAHVHSCFSAFTEAAMAALSARGVPFVFTPHGKLTTDALSRRAWLKLMWWKLRARRCVNAARHITVCGYGEDRAFARLGIHPPVTVIPNGYDAPAGLADLAAIEPTPYLLFLGYLDPRKQLPFLLRAYAGSSACRTHRLLLVGPDPYGHRAELEAEVASLGLQDAVTFAGAAFGETKWRYLRHATAFVLPSRAEGQPVVLAEAMGAGCPVIMSAACNSSHLSECGAAIEVPGFRVEDWATAIDRVCGDASLQRLMRERAAGIAPDLAWPAITARYHRLYDRIAIEHAARPTL